MGLAAQRVGKIFGQRMGDVDAEPVDAAVGPEPQGFDEVLPDVGIGPVQVRLFGGEQVQVPLAVGKSFPGAATEVGLPVRGWFCTVGAGALPEDVPVAFR